MTPVVESFLRSRGGETRSLIVGFATGAGGTASSIIISPRAQPPVLSASSQRLIRRSVAEHQRGEWMPLDLDALETDDE